MFGDIEEEEEEEDLVWGFGENGEEVRKSP